MKKIVILIFAIFPLSLLFPAVLYSANRGTTIASANDLNVPIYDSYHALVVGISDYQQWPDLPYAVSDAKEVAKRLGEMGFSVNLVTDPDSQKLKTAIHEMTYRMGQKKKRAVLFYYAGHGETEIMADGTKMGYIIPRDCPLLAKNPMGFASRAVSMRDIESASLRIRAKHVLMLFDSCFSGALFALVRAVPSDITEKSTLPVRQFITAGREDEQVPDKSMFKRCFLIGLKGAADMTGDGYITGSEMGMYLADNVVNYTRRRQHPQYGKINNPDLDQGDFIFVPLKTLAKQQQRKQLSSEKQDLLKDVRNLRTEREETHQLLKEMKELLQQQQQAQQQGTKTLKEKKALENQIAQLGKERETIEQLADTRVKEYQARLSDSKKRIETEAEKREALERELKKLKREREANQKAAQELKIQTPQSDKKVKPLLLAKKETVAAASPGILQDKPAKHKIHLGTKKSETPIEVHKPKISVPANQQLAYAPKKIDPNTLARVVLRQKPIQMLESDIEKMILDHGFYLKSVNEKRGFPNNLSENGDGTITDHSTGLMWQKGGSSYQRYHYGIEDCITDLNDDKFCGYGNWRLPTLEELCSLMRKEDERTGMYVDPLFDHSKKKCWSSDSSTAHEVENAYYVDFSDGVIVLGYGRNEVSRYEIVEAINYVKAVRNVK